MSSKLHARHFFKPLLPFLFPFLALLHLASVSNFSPFTHQLVHPHTQQQQQQQQQHVRFLSAHHQLQALLQTPLAIQLQANVKSEHPFVLYRALGNDLPPRHHPAQTLTNLRFILENEPAHPALHTRWLLNRIVHPEQELRLVKLLLQHRQPFSRIPFQLNRYLQIDFDLFGSNSTTTAHVLHTKEWNQWQEKQQRDFWAALMSTKNQYVMHNNQARNKMLQLGKQSGARWILPWDGNCFLNRHAWNQILDTTVRFPDAKYIVVNMTRMVSNHLLKNPDWAPPHAREEPQIMFRNDAQLTFNEEMKYGHTPKVELLWRLRVPGWWDRSPPDYGPWARGETPNQPDGEVVVSGWVARLFSGVKYLEVGKGGGKARGQSRVVGVENLLATATRLATGWNQQVCMIYDLQQQLPPPFHSDVSHTQHWPQLARNLTASALHALLSTNTNTLHRTASMITTLFQTNVTLQQGDSVEQYVELAPLLDVVRMLFRKNYLTEQDMQHVNNWVTEWTHMLQAQGHEDYYADDERGLLFDIQAAAAYSFLDDFKMALRYVAFARLRSVSNVSAWCVLGTMGNRMGIKYEHIQRGVRACLHNAETEGTQRWTPVLWKLAMR